MYVYLSSSDDTMIEKAFIEEYGSGRMEDEMRDLRSELVDRGIPVELFTAKRLQRRQVPISSKTLVAGTIPVVLSALKQLNVELPEPEDYPECLQRFLHRRIWTSTVGSIRERLHDGLNQPLFVKPKGRLKRFTGFVAADPNDSVYFEGASGALPVFCSEVVRWQSEWRAFIIRGTVVGIRPYTGDRSCKPDDAVIQEAVDTWQDSGKAHAAYAIDFGVLQDGTTALVELNDGFSIGAYGLDRGLYTDLTIERWCEMVRQTKTIEANNGT